MNNVLPENRNSPALRLAVFLTPALIMSSPLVSFLKFQGYPLLTAEVAYAAGGIFVLSLGLGALARWCGRAGAAVAIAVAIILFVDFQFEARLTYLAVGFVLLLVLGWFAARVLLPILAVVFAVVLLSTLVLPAQLHKADVAFASERDIRTDLVPVLHIILDEQIGVEGIEASTVWEQRAREDLKGFYLENGFRLFGGAYSNYAETFNSIPNVLNDTLSTESWQYVSAGADGLSAVGENRHLRQYSENGYGLRIYQSKYFNFCEAPGLTVLSCKSYNYTGLDNLDKLTQKALIRAELILARFLNRSRIYGIGRSVYQTLAARGFGNLRRLENNNYAPLASYPFFDVLEKDLAKATGGQVYFAHLLIPHRPFMFNADCDIVLDHAYDSLDRQSSEWLVEYRKAYYEQVGCTTRLMRGLFGSLRRSGLYDRLTIIVHGDHGSRIGPHDPTPKNWELFTPSDLRAHYSTLFAVKAPGMKGGYDDRLFSVRRLLGAVVNQAGDLFAPSPDDEHIVILRAEKGETMEMKRLPDFRVKPVQTDTPAATGG